jgi:hypothetical protein
VRTANQSCTAAEGLHHIFAFLVLRLADASLAGMAWPEAGINKRTMAMLWFRLALVALANAFSGRKDNKRVTDPTGGQRRLGPCMTSFQG